MQVSAAEAIPPSFEESTRVINPEVTNMTEWPSFLFAKYGSLLDPVAKKKYYFQKEYRLLAFTDRWVFGRALIKGSATDNENFALAEVRKKKAPTNEELLRTVLFVSIRDLTIVTTLACYQRLAVVNLSAHTASKLMKDSWKSFVRKRARMGVVKASGRLVQTAAQSLLLYHAAVFTVDEALLLYKHFFDKDGPKKRTVKNLARSTGLNLMRCGSAVSLGALGYSLGALVGSPIKASGAFFFIFGMIFELIPYLIFHDNEEEPI